MTRVIRRRLALQGTLAFAAAPFVQPVRACEYYAPNFTLVHPWTRASRPGATTAQVCMSFKDVSAGDRLVGVQTPVAEGAELAGPGVGPQLDLAIAAGQTLELTERGVHLRLVGLQFPLEVARTYPMTLLFEQAGELRTTLNVDYARFA